MDRPRRVMYQFQYLGCIYDDGDTNQTKLVSISTTMNSLKESYVTRVYVVPARFTKNQSNERYGYLSFYVAFNPSSKISKAVRCVFVGTATMR